jgi:hypothetical protein
MKTNLLIAAVVMWCAFLFSATPTPELYVDFEGVAAGTTDSSINMGAISHTNATFTYDWVGSAGRVSVENGGLGHGLFRPIKVGSTLYTNANPTHHLLCKSDSGVSTPQRFRWTFSGASRKISYGFSITLSNFVNNGGTTGFYNCFGAESGVNYSYLSFVDDVTTYFQNEGTTSPYGQDVSGGFNNITIWVTGIWDSAQASANDRSRQYYYNQTNMVLIGFSIDPFVTQNATVNQIFYGITDGHSKSAGTSYRLGSLIVYTNGNQFPVWPGTFLQVPTNFSPAGVSAAIAASANGDSILLPSTNSTWSSGVTFNGKTNVDMAGIHRSGLGTNNTVITLSAEFEAIGLGGSYNTVSNLQMRGAGVSETGTAISMDNPWNRVSRCFFRLLNVPVYGKNFGLVDNCVIGDSFRFARVIMDDSFYSTYYPLAWDSTNYFVMEDNYMYWSSSKLCDSGACEACITSQDTDSWIARHNYFSLENSVADPGPLFDFHGDEVGSGLPHPGIAVQIYSNRVFRSTSWNGKFADIRGSRSLIYSNYCTTVDVLDGIAFREERPTDVPNYKVNNSYCWQNYDGASATVPMTVTGDADVVSGVAYFESPLSPLPSLGYPHFLRGESQSGGGTPVPPSPLVRLRNIRLASP